VLADRCRRYVNAAADRPGRSPVSPVRGPGRGIRGPAGGTFTGLAGAGLLGKGLEDAACGGVRGGIVVGSSDKSGGHPVSDPQTPENLAATIYDFLGIPLTARWRDALDRPHHVYHGRPITGLC
jgi:hypothetical protein